MEGKNLYSLIVGQKSPAPVQSRRLHPVNREEMFKKSGLGMMKDRQRRNEFHQINQKNKKFNANLARRGITLDDEERDDVVDENEPKKKISQKKKEANDRAIKLAEFRTKKDMRLRDAEQNKKPPFNVGVYKGFDKFDSKNLPKINTTMLKTNNVFVFGGKSTKNVAKGTTTKAKQPIANLIANRTRSKVKPKVADVVEHIKKLHVSVESQAKEEEQILNKTFTPDNLEEEVQTLDKTFTPEDLTKHNQKKTSTPEKVDVIKGEENEQHCENIFTSPKADGVKEKSFGDLMTFTPTVPVSSIQIIVNPPSEIEATTDNLKTPKVLKNKDRTPLRKIAVSANSLEELEMENNQLTHDAHDVPYFKDILKKNDDAMEQKVKLWTKKVNELEEMSNLKDDVLGKIRSTIGKAILLTNKKGRFEQFRTLIENCEFKLGEQATTCMDLQGFWEMIYFQIEDVEKLFADLDQLEKKNWVEDEPKKPNLKKKPIPKKSVLKPKQSTAAAPSKFRQMLMAKRKAMQEKSEKPDEGISFNAGFFKVETTPKRLSTSPRNDILATNSATGILNSLRKEVLTKHVSKSAGVNPTTPLLMIAATKACRRSMSRENSPVIQLDFDADDVKEDKENEENLGPVGFKTPNKYAKKSAKTPAKTPIFLGLGTQVVRRSQRLSITPKKDYKENK